MDSSIETILSTREYVCKMSLVVSSQGVVTIQPVNLSLPREFALPTPALYDAQSKSSWYSHSSTQEETQAQGSSITKKEKMPLHSQTNAT